MAVFLFVAAGAWANPTSPNVVSGSASFATSGNTLTVTNSSGTIINWQGFSIQAGEQTTFAQPSASSVVLNRVTSANPSSILGALNSNGRVFLTNPNGVLIGAGAQVNAAAFVATTVNISDATFLAGNYTFISDPSATGSTVSAEGNLSITGNLSLASSGIDIAGGNLSVTGSLILTTSGVLNISGAVTANSIEVNTGPPPGNISIPGAVVVPPIIVTPPPIVVSTPPGSISTSNVSGGNITGGTTVTLSSGPAGGSIAITGGAIGAGSVGQTGVLVTLEKREPMF